MVYFEEMLRIRFSRDELESLREALSDMIKPVQILVFVSDVCSYCGETIKLVKILRDQSPTKGGDKLIKVNIYDRDKDPVVFEKYNVKRTPTLLLIDGQIRYTGIPSGEEIRALVETIIRISREESELSDNTVEKLKELKSKVHIETIVTPTCPYCPYAVLLANMFAFEAWRNNNKNLVSEAIEAYENMDIADRYGVMSVPTVAINGEVEFIGVPYEEDLLSKILEKAEVEHKREARRKTEEMLKKYLREYLTRLEK